jgi:signal peptidase I
MNSERASNDPGPGDVSSSVHKRRKISPLRKWIGAALCVLVCSFFILLATGRYRALRVTSDSMMPTIDVGDCLLVDARSSIQPYRGCIVAIQDPDDKDGLLCKRLIGMPDDRVELPLDGYLYVNAERQAHEPYVSTHNVGTDKARSWDLKAGEHIVLGDNREVSYDSREFGVVTSEEIVGVVVACYWPPSRIRSFRGEKATH